MSNSYFQFKQFIIYQDRCAMKVTTDSCLFGAWAADKIRNTKSDVNNILDVGSGTGLLSLMIAQQSNATIDTVEIDKDAYEQAKENFINSPWSDRINVIQGDVRTFVTTGQYDVIISNPPFYENELKSDNNKKNRAHHDTGLLLSELLPIIHQNLQPQGEFYLLLPYKKNENPDKLFAASGLAVLHKTFVKQSTQHNYFRILLAGKHLKTKNLNSESSEIIIKNEKQEYTSEFIDLLKNYYLYL